MNRGDVAGRGSIATDEKFGGVLAGADSGGFLPLIKNMDKRSGVGRLSSQKTQLQGQRVERC